MILRDEAEVVGTTDLAWSRPLLRVKEADGLSEQWSFETTAFLEEYFLICLLEEGLNIEPRLELAGPSTSSALVLESGAPVDASMPLSSKQIKSEEGTSVLVDTKSQQQKFRLQSNFGCEDGRENVAPVP